MIAGIESGAQVACKHLEQDIESAPSTCSVLDFEQHKDESDPLRNMALKRLTESLGLGGELRRQQRLHSALHSGNENAASQGQQECLNAAGAAGLSVLRVSTVGV